MARGEERIATVRGEGYTGQNQNGVSFEFSQLLPSLDVYSLHTHLRAHTSSAVSGAGGSINVCVCMYYINIGY